MIYHLNCEGLYYHQSAIETVQRDRQKCFDSLNEDNMHIFCGHYDGKSVYKLLTEYGIDPDRVIFLPCFYAHTTVTSVSYSVQNFESTLQDDFAVDVKDNVRKYTWSQSDIAKIVYLEDGCVFKVDTYKNNKVIFSDFYTDHREWTDFYNKTGLFMRRYYDRFGTVVIEEIFDEADKSDQKALFKISNHPLMKWHELIEDMLLKMQVGKNDIILIDRYISADIFSNKLYDLTNIVYIFHSTHREINHDFIKLWGYGAKLRQFDRIAGYVVPTERQAEDAKADIKAMYDYDCNRIWGIPVGCISELRYTDKPRKRRKFMAAGRLITSKGFDTAIRVIADLKQYYPDISLDIYGLGLLDKYLLELAKKLGCSDNIKLCGFHDLTYKYLEYDALIAGTLYEGSSLVFTEALASGCPVICFDTPYSGLSVIQDGYNGYRQHLGADLDYKERAAILADAVKKYCELNDDSVQQMRDNAYESAKNHLFEEVTEKWRQFLKDIRA